MTPFWYKLVPKKQFLRGFTNFFPELMDCNHSVHWCLNRPFKNTTPPLSCQASPFPPPPPPSTLFLKIWLEASSRKGEGALWQHKLLILIESPNIFNWKLAKKVKWVWSSRLFRTIEFGNGSRISDELHVILELKYLQNKKW